MLDATKAYSSFASNDVAAAKRFYGQTLGLDVAELYDGGLLELRLGDDRRVLIYSKDDFVPATFTVLNFPVRDVDAAVDELARAGVEMARFDGFDQDAKGIAWRRRTDDRLVPRSRRQHPGGPQRRAAARLSRRCPTHPPATTARAV
jgi:catechol 2,3-dioxygenase-like lactoylglutathione lyase family enzyme